MDTDTDIDIDIDIDINIDMDIARLDVNCPKKCLHPLCLSTMLPAM